jgi:hypothetical protein
MAKPKESDQQRSGKKGRLTRWGAGDAGLALLSGFSARLQEGGHLEGTARFRTGANYL